MITPRDVARVARQEHIPVWLAQALAAKVTLEEGLRADRERPDRLSVVDASPIAPLLLEIAADGFAGTCTELLDRLELRAEPETRRSKAWPKTPQALSGRLHRLAPTLRANDVEVEWDRLPGGNRTRIVRLHKHEQPSVPSVPAVPSATAERDARDARDEPLGDDDVRRYFLHFYPTAGRAAVQGSASVSWRTVKRSRLHLREGRHQSALDEDTVDLVESVHERRRSSAQHSTQPILIGEPRLDGGDDQAVVRIAQREQPALELIARLVTRRPKVFVRCKSFELCRQCFDGRAVIGRWIKQEAELFERGAVEHCMLGVESGPKPRVSLINRHGDPTQALKKVLSLGQPGRHEREHGARVAGDADGPRDAAGLGQPKRGHG